MHKACGLLLQEGEALMAEFRLGTYDAEALDLDKVHHDAAAAPADAKYVSQARRTCGCPCDMSVQWVSCVAAGAQTPMQRSDCAGTPQVS